MNTLLRTTLVVAALAVGGIAHAGDITAPATVDTNFHTGYIPDGFDTNDNTQLVAEGMFSNTCYRPAAVEASIDDLQKTVTLKPTAYFYSGMCLQMIVPFNQVVNLGIMKAGDYKVMQSGNNNALGNLTVRVATNSTPDDFLYAPISQAYMASRGGKTYVTVSGSFTNSCMSLADVMVNVQPKVVVVQPISVTKEGVACTGGEFPFERTVEVKGVTNGRYLLHVRSLNGNSVNTLVDIQ